MKTLINVPRLDMPGGVANYFRTIKVHLNDVEYFEIGAIHSEFGIVETYRRILSDYWRFHIRLSAGDYRLVHLNPSLVSKSVIRDAIFLMIAKWHRKKVLVFFRGWDPSCLAAVRRRHRRIFRLVFGRADAYIVLAQEFLRAFRDLGIAAPIYVETTVVDDYVLSLSDSTIFQDKDPASPTNILFLSRLDKGKGVHRSIESFSLASKRCPNICLTIAGDGPCAQSAQELAKSNGLENIEFLGHIEGDEKHSAFLQADIFFFPTSFGEGMPNAVLEAMAYGLPIITRSVGGLADFFENEIMGYITKSEHSPDFSDLLVKLISNKSNRLRIGHYNREYAKENFAASAVARRLLDIYAKT